ncbi:hypothetical protein [Spirillospora sp. NPDC047279]|uniref:hypothetical protein n=1 Tax=Spirillospora sp. NPDC047279 TaxID=3155478 RepID=UPI00340F88D7
MTSVTFRDETAAGGRTLHEFTVPGLPAAMTVRDLIRLRVREEVARHNAAPSRFNGLVRPVGAETELNGARPPRRVDWERQADVAERAFTSNGFFMFVGDVQAGDLDEVVDLTGDPGLTFIRLVPLAGG